MKFHDFKDKVSTIIDVDLSSYKEQRVERRINNLITKNKLNDYDGCLKKLKESKEFQT